MYEVFANLLNERGLRAIDVTRGTGLPSSLFSEWKKGKSTPKTDKMQKIATFFGVSLEYMTTGEDSSANAQSFGHDFDKRYFAYAKRLNEMGIIPERLEALIEAVENLKKEV